MDTPTILYKYRPVNDYLRDILVGHHVYFSDISQFNDPFDCAPLADSSGTIAEWKRYLTTIGSRESAAMDRNSRRQWTRNIIKASPLFNGKMPIGSPEADAFLLEAIMEPIRETGIFSTSEKQDDILMWGHYAQSHTGVCIGFAAHQLDGEAYKIRYKEDRPLISPLRDQDVLIEKALMTKSIHWSYEHEWRLLNRKKVGRVGFARGSIKGIILGARISAADEAKVRQWWKDGFLNNAALYRAKLSDRTFDIKIVPCS